uniref:Uncharacterized protein n=1 Tax=Megaselia scalaris TaxID=36166 RepID=T1GXA5_MEGSC
MVGVREGNNRILKLRNLYGILRISYTILDVYKAIFGIPTALSTSALVSGGHLRCFGTFGTDFFEIFPLHKDLLCIRYQVNIFVLTAEFIVKNPFR